MNYQGAFKGFLNERPMVEEQSYTAHPSNIHNPVFLRGSNEPIEVLMVAEKPSIARTIADCLTGGKYLTRRGICKDKQR